MAPKSQKDVFVFVVSSLGILIFDNLIKRGYHKWIGVVSVNHLLLHCPIASKLWSMVWSLFGVIWVMPQSVADLFASWQGPFGRQHNIDLCLADPHCVLWCLWRERNNRCFEGMEWSTLEIKSLLLHSLFTWCCAFSSFSWSNLFVMLDHCNFRSWCNSFHVHSWCTWGFCFMKYRY